MKDKKNARIIIACGILGNAFFIPAFVLTIFYFDEIDIIKLCILYFVSFLFFMVPFCSIIKKKIFKIIKIKNKKKQIK